MPQFTKGTPKPAGSGRKPGTPNKRTTLHNQAIKAFVDNYLGSPQMEADFKSLEPRDRLIIAERYATHVYTKPQSVDISISNPDNNHNTLSEKLSSLAQHYDS